MDDLEIETCGGVDGGSIKTSAPAATTTISTLEVMIDARTEPEPYPKRRMEQVPLIMRRHETTKGYFDPKVVSIGPYHHGKEELQMAERIKPIVAELFIAGSGRDMDEFRKNVLEMVDDAKSCYTLEGLPDYSDEVFAEMMLLDGLFVLAFTETLTPDYSNQTIGNELTKHLGHQAVFLLPTDIMYLLENQLPFQVLELLMSLKSKHHKYTEMLDKFLDFWESLISSRHDKKEVREELRWLLAKERIDDTKQPIHVLQYIWLWSNKIIQSNDIRGISSTSHMSDLYYSFKSVAELKAKGIYARRRSGYLRRDFEFKSFFFYAVLEIPPIILSPQFIVAISNQIAYEWTPNNHTNLPTMAYMNFIKSLINTIEDVKELRARNILFSPCTSDEEVIKLFNSIPTFVIEDFSIYEKVKRDIQEHYNNKAKTWFAELIHNYFSSPWTFIAFVAATVLIITSCLQTYFTIFPRK